jgi:hypothetical protein
MSYRQRSRSSSSCSGDPTPEIRRAAAAEGSSLRPRAFRLLVRRGCCEGPRDRDRLGLGSRDLRWDRPLLGGLGDAVLETLADADSDARVRRLAVHTMPTSGATATMESGTPAVISRMRGVLLLSCTQASVAEFRRQTLALNELRVSSTSDRAPHRSRIRGEAGRRHCSPLPFTTGDGPVAEDPDSVGSWATSDRPQYRSPTLAGCSVNASGPVGNTVVEHGRATGSPSPT